MTEAGNDQFLFTILCIAGALIGWMMYNGNPRKKDLQFVYPPRPRWEVTLTILYDSVTGALVLSTVPILFFAILSVLSAGLPKVDIKDTPPSPMIPHISNLGCFINAFIFCSGFMSFYGIFNGIWNLYLVRRERFKIAVDPLEASLVPTLGDALSSKNNRTRELGFYDLKVVVDAEEARIFDFLKLSHPGRHPFAWNTVLKPIISLIEGATVYFKDFIIAVRQETRPDNAVGKDSVQKPNLDTNFFASEKHTENLKSSPRFRDLVAPVQTKVTFYSGNDSTKLTTTLTSPLSNLIAAPANILTSTFDKFSKALQAKYANARKFAHRSTMNDQLKAILVEQKLLVWATQILVGICDFSITKDMDGVISTTIGRIVPVHVELYCTLEQLVEEFRPIRHKILRKEIEKLVSLLTEYKKSLVFFYVNYAPHATVLRIPPAAVKRWKRICNDELGRRGPPDLSCNTRHDMNTPTLFIDEE